MSRVVSDSRDGIAIRRGIEDEAMGLCKTVEPVGDLESLVVACFYLVTAGSCAVENTSV